MRSVLRSVQFSSLLLGLILSAWSPDLRSQVQLDLSLTVPDSQSGTGWSSVSNTTAGKAFIDYYTVKAIDGAIPANRNLVGGSDLTSSAVATSNPMLQIQTGYIGGTTASDLGIAFRLRLGQYDNTQSVTGMVGVMWTVPNQTNGTDAVSFAVAVTLNSSGSAFTSYSLGLLWKTDSNTINKDSNFNTTAQGFDASTTLLSNQSFTSVTATAANSPFASIQSTTNVFTKPGGTDTTDAWLSFGVTFASVNNNVAAIARTASGTVNPFDATTARWGFSPVVGAGSAFSSFAGGDAVGTTGNIYVSDALYANGSSVAGSTPTIAAVPEPSTFLMIPALLIPLVPTMLRKGLFRRPRLA